MIPETPALAQAYINQALLLQHQAEFDEAMTIAQMAREEFPNHIMVWRMLNEIYLAQNRAAEVAMFFASRLPAAPTHETLDHFTLLARAERFAGKPQRAAELTDAVLKLEPKWLEARFEYGLALQPLLPMRQDCNWKSISVCLPSRFTVHPHTGRLWLEHAIESIRAQTMAHKYPIQICVGIDHGAAAPEIFAGQPDIIFANVAADAPKNQAAAVNAAAGAATGDIIAFLEDDDTYMPERLEHALLMLQKYDFVGGTQTATTPDHSKTQIFDYNNPSTWVMRHEFWKRIGPMDTSYKFHLDAEWLGRLNASGGLRVHEVDGAAPREWHALATSRGFYKYFYSVIKPGSGVVFTPYAYPLGTKTVHEQSISDITLHNPEWQRKSDEEHTRMEEKYNGRPF
jgi:tetratricopeptide (TPR) repeat protein